MTRIIISLLLTLTFNVLSAQTPAYRKYSVKDGLPSSNIYHTYQDSKGFIWICTDKGIAKFDGYKFKIYTTKDGMPRNDVFGLTEDQQGRLWLSTLDEVCYFKDGVFQSKPLKETKSKIITHFINSHDEHYFTAGNQLYKVEDDSTILLIGSSFNYENKDSLYRKNAPITITFANGNFIHLYKSDNHNDINETYSINLNSTHIEDLPAPFDKELFMFLHKDYILNILEHNGEFIFFTMLGVYNFKNKSLKGIQPLNKIEKDENIIRVWLGKNKIWIKTTSSLKCFNKQFNEISLGYLDYLESLKVNQIFTDNNNNLWISTKKGLYFIPSLAQGWNIINLGENEHNNSISSLELDNNGSLWIGTENGQIFNYQKNRITQSEISFSGGQPTRCITTTNDYIYTAGLLLKKIKKSALTNSQKSSRPEEYILKHGKGLGSVKKTKRSEDNIILVASSSGAYSFTEEGKGKLLSSERSYAIAKKQDSIWIGHTDGLELFTNGNLIDLRNRNGVFSKSINDLTFDKNNWLWIATDGFGVHLTHSNHMKSISELNNTIVHSIHVSTNNQIWLGTNSGAAKIEIVSYHPFEYNFQKITSSHGLPSDEVTTILTKNDTVYIGTKEGLLEIHSSEISPIRAKPFMSFTEIKINNNPVKLTEKYELSSKENSISIDYVCPSYESDGNINYSYKLEGIDSDFKQTSSLSKEYTTLSPGSYIFRIYATDIDGIKTPEKTIQFHISLPWWKNGALAFIAALVFGSLIFFIFKKREKYILEKAADENAINKKFAELELKALRAQMNPHFIFNAINSIQDFIFDKDERTANKYLVKFSRLMRLFLESSKHKYTVLSNELEILQLYVELEKLRFQKKFDYSIYVDKNIQPESLNIPSMILQPFVENAINHGLYYSNKKGHLSIRIEKEKNEIICTIEDNGIGRKKASEFRKSNTKEHISRGMELVDDRKKMLNYVEGQNIEIETIDLMDNEGKGIGTRVIISIFHKRTKSIEN